MQLSLLFFHTLINSKIRHLFLVIYYFFFLICNVPIKHKILKSHACLLFPWSTILASRKINIGIYCKSQRKVYVLIKLVFNNDYIKKEMNHIKHFYVLGGSNKQSLRNPTQMRHFHGLQRE